MADPKSTNNPTFIQATEQVKSLATKPDQSTLLELYAFFKQAILGDVQGDRPGMLDFQAKAKYDAWAGKKGMAKEEAQKKYVELVNKLKG